LLLPINARMSVGNSGQMVASAIGLRLVIDQFLPSGPIKN
jgi:hypothetical protein